MSRKRPAAAAAAPWSEAPSDSGLASDQDFGLPDSLLELRRRVDREARATPGRATACHRG